MSNKANQRIRDLIAEYMAAGHAAETSNIANHIKDSIGVKPSRTTIGIILREMGYIPIEQPRFIWRHKEG
jgi:hypothetical protein